MRQDTERRSGVVWFWTQSGAIYRIDYGEKTWHRQNDHYSLRTPNGVFNDISEIVIGKPVLLVCPPIIVGAGGRLIESTPVVSVQSDERR